MFDYIKFNIGETGLLSKKGEGQLSFRSIRETFRYRPLVYYWSVLLNDGVIVSQFDSKTGNENTLADVIASYSNRIVTARWIPFGEKLVSKINCSVLVLPIPRYQIDIDQGQVLVLCRQNRYHHTGNSIRGRVEYLLGIENEPIKHILENGKFITS